MLDVHFPTTDGRELVFRRYTQPEADQKLCRVASKGEQCAIKPGQACEQRWTLPALRAWRRPERSAGRRKARRAGSPRSSSASGRGILGAMKNIIASWPIVSVLL
jgi:hypothetical protein